jgi:hypothetical protein
MLVKSVALETSHEAEAKLDHCGIACMENYWSVTPKVSRVVRLLHNLPAEDNLFPPPPAGFNHLMLRNTGILAAQRFHSLLGRATGSYGSHSQYTLGMAYSFDRLIITAGATSGDSVPALLQL